MDLAHPHGQKGALISGCGGERPGPRRSAAPGAESGRIPRWRAQESLELTPAMIGG